METRGSVLLGSVVALILAGFGLVDGVLLALAAAGGLLLVFVWGLGMWNLRALDVEVEMPKVLQAGREARIGMRLRNRRRMLDGFGLMVQLEAPGKLSCRGRLPWIPARDEAWLELRESAQERGAGEVLEVEVVSQFPLGLFRFSIAQQIPHALTVLPRPLAPREWQAVGRLLEGEPQMSFMSRESMGELRGLREFGGGDSVKAVAWPASLRARARGGGLLVRDLDPPGFHPREAVVLCHSFGKDGALIRPDRFETALAVVWGVMRRFHANGVPVVFLADFNEWIPERVMERKELALLGHALAKARRADSTEEHELKRRLDEIRQEQALVVTSDMPIEQWRGLFHDRPEVLAVDVSGFEPGGGKGGWRA